MDALVEIHDGLSDLKESEQIVIEDYCDEIAPESFHFYPEAYDEEDWANELDANKVKPDELAQVATKVTQVRQYLLERSAALESGSQVGGHQSQQKRTKT
jgi:hypothetical protein